MGPQIKKTAGPAYQVRNKLTDGNTDEQGEQPQEERLQSGNTDHLADGGATTPSNRKI